MLQDFALIVLGLTALFFGGDALVKGAARLASAFGLPPLVVGLTIVAFGTSVPELLVSVDAALRGSSDIGLGNVIGSNIANIGLILGISGLIVPIVVDWKLIIREIPIMIGVTIAAVLLALDGAISLMDGAILVFMFIAFNIFVYVMAQRDKSEIMPELTEYTEAEHITPKTQVKRTLEVARFIGGVLLLAFGAQWTVAGASSLARGFGVSEFIIGVTIVAFGTSLPELVASIMGAIRKETDIIMGNIVGSNIANLLAILGITALVRPLPVEQAILQTDALIMIAFAVMVLPFVWNRRLPRWSAALLLLGYGVFIVMTVI
jgi:cation:H+ antiporter